MDRKRKLPLNKCDLPKCLGVKRKSKCDSASSGATHHNGYWGKICDIWHRKGDEKLFPDWLKEVQKHRSLIRGREKNQSIAPPWVVTHTCVVELIFKMCKELKQPADTRYRTVELFERFVANQFSNLAQRTTRKEDRRIIWKNNIPRFSSQALLRVVSCIQLASKYCSCSSIIPPKVAHLYLTKRGHNYPIRKVLTSEMKVFKSLEFNVGVPTLLVFVDVLLPLIREYIHDRIYTVCINVIDIVYLQRNQIFEELSNKLLANWQYSRQKKLSFTAHQFDGLYCGAACIISAVEIYYPNNAILIGRVNNKLARLVERPSKDILMFANIILQAVGMC